jgi:hypothetical protein
VAEALLLEVPSAISSSILQNHEKSLKNIDFGQIVRYNKLSL